MNKKSNIPWPTEPIESLFIDRTGGQRKILRSEYETIGAFPIIDQGKEYSNGFTNDESKLYHGNIPLVLFGDHTREVKYVNQPFALGADGVKALDPHPRLLAKFLYFFLLYSPVESRGYSRHFKFLKEKAIPLPPLAEQNRIVEILDQADQLRQQRRQADALSQRILPALFHEMFGNLDTNSKGWYKESLEKLTIIDAPFVSPLEQNYLDLPHIGPDSIEKATGKLLQWRTAREDGLKSGKFLFDSSHVLYSKIRPNLRKVAIPEFEGLCSADVYPVRPSDDRTTREFLLALLLSDHFTEYTLTVSARANMPKVNREQFGAYQAIVPDQQSMIKFSYSVQKLLPLRHNWNTSITTLETLFQTLLHRAFDGSLTAKWREGQADETLKEMKNQTKH